MSALDLAFFGHNQAGVQRGVSFMQSGQFSRTALGAAGHRAAHQVLEGGATFADPLAVPILGEDAEAMIAEARDNPDRRMLRFFIAGRSRFAEGAATAAMAAGVRQIVVLGAGLDTFAYRVEPRDGLRVFEVDHPATQAEKRRRLVAAGIGEPAHLTFAPCDFETDDLGARLREVGFDGERASVFIWLGVVPYLTPSAVFATLGFVGGLPGGAEIVFDYANPTASIADAETREFHAELAQRVAAAGEAFKSYFETETLHAALRARGFAEIEDLGPDDIAPWVRGGRGDAPRGRGAHLISATTRGRAAPA
jgi:methyltransferase (TIGR00027 family)